MGINLAHKGIQLRLVKRFLFLCDFLHQPPDAENHFIIIFSQNLRFLKAMLTHTDFGQFFDFPHPLFQISHGNCQTAGKQDPQQDHRAEKQCSHKKHHLKKLLFQHFQSIQRHHADQYPAGIFYFRLINKKIFLFIVTIPLCKQRQQLLLFFRRSKKSGILMIHQLPPVINQKDITLSAHVQAAQMFFNHPIFHIHQKDAHILTGAVRDLRAHRNHPVVFIRGKALHPRSGKNGHRVMDGFHVPVFLHHIFRNRHIQIFLIGKDTSVLGNHHDGFLAVIIFKQLFNVRHQYGTEALIVFLQILPQDRAVGKNIRFPLHSGNIGSNVITAQFQKIMGFGNHLIHQQTGCKEINGPAQNQYYRQPQAQIEKRNLHAEPAEPVSDPTSVFHVPPPF